MFKNKTLATFLAFLAGGIGLHRFYLRGMHDQWGWVHFSTLLLTGLAIRIWPEQPLMFTGGPLVLSILVGFVEALVIGLTPDEKWDETHNRSAAKKSNSRWPLALLLVLITGTGAVALIAVLARTLDLLFTGGSFG